MPPGCSLEKQRGKPTTQAQGPRPGPLHGRAAPGSPSTPPSSTHTCTRVRARQSPTFDTDLRGRRPGLEPSFPGHQYRATPRLPSRLLSQGTGAERWRLARFVPFGSSRSRGQGAMPRTEGGNPSRPSHLTVCPASPSVSPSPPRPSTTRQGGVREYGAHQSAEQVTRRTRARGRVRGVCVLACVCVCAAKGGGCGTCVLRVRTCA